MSAPPTSPRISIEDVAVGYGGRAVQSGISADIENGEIFAIVGDSGSGKSTLLKMMVGLLPPQAGRIPFDERALDERMQDGAPPFGILFQSGALWTSMSVLDNVILPMDLQGYSVPAARPALARFKLALVGLAGDENRYPASLSGGMRSITVVLVTHELESLYSIADRMLFLDGEAHRPVGRAPATAAHRAARLGLARYVRGADRGQHRRDVLRGGRGARHPVGCVG